MLPEKHNEVQAWLNKASEDLRACQVDMAAEPPILHDALFHCQQAVEKAMKGFLTAHDRPFRRTHELDVLAASCEKIDPSLRPVLDPARDLSFYAWAFRYPGEEDVPTPTEADEAYALANAVFEAVLQRLSDELKP